MSDNYPLYPNLSEQAEQEAQELMNTFREKFKKVAHDTIEDSLSELYCDITPYIQSDSWTNFRNQIMDGFRNYNNRKIY